MAGRRVVVNFINIMCAPAPWFLIFVPLHLYDTNDAPVGRSTININAIIMSGKFSWLTGDKRIWILYFFAALACWLLKITGHNQNNFLIFRASYYHLVHHLNLYAAYPAEHDDMFYYGPLFPVFFAPFALLPKAIGLLLWELANAAAYLIAVNYLPQLSTARKCCCFFVSLNLPTLLFPNSLTRWW